MDDYEFKWRRGEAETQIRFAEIEAYLQKPDFKRIKSELPDVTAKEREYLAHSIRNIYRRAKGETDQKKRLQLMARFYDCLTLLLCDPAERKMAFCPPDGVEQVVFKHQRDCLGFSTGTSGERIYFQIREDQGETKNRERNRHMIYPNPTDSATEMGRKYFERFNEAFGTNLVNLDQLVLEDL